MPRIALTRHGEAAWEVGQRLMGQADPELTDRGLAQANALVPRLRELDIGVILTSPLQRSRQTAAVIGQGLNLTPEFVPGFIDLDFGAWTGRTADDLLRQEPDAYATWLERPESVQFAGGESLPDLRGRVESALEDVLAAHPEDANLLIVTHEHVARSLLTLLLGLGPGHHWQIALDPASLSVFERRGGMSYLTLLNEGCHLAGVSGSTIVLPRS